MRPVHSWQGYIPLWVILFVGFLLRMMGIRFGLPELYHADEPIVVHHALAYGAGDLNPHFFKIPPLVSYLLFIIYGIYFLIGRLAGRFENADDFLLLFLRDPSFFYLSGRIFLGAILGVLTIYFLYLLVRKFFSEKHALISAFFLAVSFLHVRDSHYIYADIPLVLILVLCFFPIFNVVSGSGRRNDMVFGLLAGIATAMKYNGIFIFIPFFIAYTLANIHRKSSAPSPGLWMTLICFSLSYLLLNPFSVLDMPFFMKELLSQSKGENFVGWLHHFRGSLWEGLGPPLLLVASGGIAASFFRAESKKIVLLAFIISYYFVIVFFSQPYERYALPLIPFVVFFASDALVRVGEKWKAANWIYLLLSVFIAFPSVVRIYHSNRIFLQTDIRTIAKRWVEEHIPAGTKLALDYPFLMPHLNPTVSQLLEKADQLRKEPSMKVNLKRINAMIKEAEKRPDSRFNLYFLSDSNASQQFLLATPTIPYDFSELIKQRVSYVLIAKTGRQTHNDFYKELRTRGRLLIELSPFLDQAKKESLDFIALTGGPFLGSDLKSRSRNGQIIEIYQI